MKVSPLDIIGALNVGGELTPFRALSKIYSKAEIRTNITPAIEIDIASLDNSGGGSPNPFMSLLRPTITLSGPEGTKVIAPAGEASHSGGLTGLLLLAGVFGIPYLLGRSQRK